MEFYRCKDFSSEPGYLSKRTYLIVKIICLTMFNVINELELMVVEDEFSYKYWDEIGRLCNPM